MDTGSLDVPGGRPAAVRLIEGAGYYPHAEMSARKGAQIVAFHDGVRDGVRWEVAHGA